MNSIKIPINVIAEQIDSDDFYSLVETFTEKRKYVDDYYHARCLANSIANGFFKGSLIDSKEELLLNLMMGVFEINEPQSTISDYNRLIKELEDAKQKFNGYIDKYIQEYKE